MKRLRLGAGLTQDQVADAMGIPQPRYYRHESGTTEATLAFILGVCKVLKVTPDVLLGFQSAVGDPLDAARSALLAKGYRMILEPLPARPGPAEPPGEAEPSPP